MFTLFNIETNWIGMQKISVFHRYLYQGGVLFLFVFNCFINQVFQLHQQTVANRIVETAKRTCDFMH